MPNTKTLLVVGNPAEGFDYIGPWEEREDAIRHAEKCGWDDPWWIVSMTTPEGART